MSSIKELYQKNIYGIMGTLIFHILLFAGLLVAELNTSVKTEKEEPVLLDLATVQEIKKEKPEPEPEAKVQPDKSLSSGQSMKSMQQAESNHAVNDAATGKATKRDKFFDESYQNDIEKAKQLVADVNKQLSKKATNIKKYEMPEATTAGQNPDSIKNVIYSGKSNIHYYLENRYHVRLPIPVYLAKSGGEIKVDIQVDRSGKVIKAEVKTSKNTNDPMLTEYALQASERTIFNADEKAPALQKGSITYRFVAQ
jgi:TonB family protein